MIGAYAIVLSVWGMVLSYVWLLHHFWLRHVFMPAENPSHHQAADDREKATPDVAVADVAERRKMEPATSVA